MSDNNFRYNVSTTHPTMPTPIDTAQYEETHFYVSVHSEDRNVLKYPNSADFEIQLPRDYYNVSKLDVSELALPINIDTFSKLFNNVYLTFTVNEPYNPADPINPTAPFPFSRLDTLIFTALNSNRESDFIVQIEDGFYSVDQIATELTNRMNYAVTLFIKEFLIKEGERILVDEFILLGGYTQFLVVYNYVSQHMWFGNRSSGFIITNSSEFYTLNEEQFNARCTNSDRFPQYVNWGLPNNLGFTRISAKSIPSFSNGDDVRFYYGDVVPGDNGYWLTSDLVATPGAVPWYVTTPNKINILGEAYIYLLIDGWNSIDVTYPFNADSYTAQTNQTNGVVEYAFGKIPVGSTPVSLSYCSGFFNPKVFEPPVNKVRKVKIGFYYHSGLKVSFDNMPFSITFDIVCLRLKRK